MCYTANDSLIGYIINSVSSIALYNITNDSQYKVMSLFLLFVGQMQIFDFAFWKNQQCNLQNEITTRLAMGFNHLQPIVFLFLQTFYGFQQSSLSIILFFFHIMVGIFYNIQSFTKIHCTLPAEGVMKWKWNDLPYRELYYLSFLGYLVVASFNFKDSLFQMVSALVILLTFIVATKTPILNKSSGRIWCYYAAFIPLLYIIMKYVHG